MEKSRIADSVENGENSGIKGEDAGCEETYKWAREVMSFPTVD